MCPSGCTSSPQSEWSASFSPSPDDSISAFEGRICLFRQIAIGVSVGVKGYRKALKPLRFQGFSWRRRRDSNPRGAFDPYTISNRARSTGLRDFSIAVRTNLRMQFVSLCIINDTARKSQAKSCAAMIALADRRRRAHPPPPVCAHLRRKTRENAPRRAPARPR